MVHFTDEELQAATEAVLNSVLEPTDLQAISHFVAKDILHGYVQRQCANALTAASRVRK